MRFSVLIPVYNVEKYLNQCLTSVLKQDYSDFEVVLVNDGSTDRSSIICQRFAESDDRIKYYDKNNEGLLLTRRYSIKRASGEYIVFLDSDDYWEPGILSKLSREIESSHPDMICYRYRAVSDDGRFLYDDVGVFPDRSFFDASNKEEFLKKFIGSSRLNVLWSKCVKNTIVDKNADYSMFGDKKGEDLLQSIALVRNANTILYLDEALVNYRLSYTGRSRNFKIKHLDDFDAVKHYIYENLLDMNVSESIMGIFYKQYLESLFNYMGLIASSAKNYESFVMSCKHIESFQFYTEFSEKINPDEMSYSYRRDNNNIKQHKYYVIFCYYRIKNMLLRIRDYFHKPY